MDWENVEGGGGWGVGVIRLIYITFFYVASLFNSLRPPPKLQTCAENEYTECESGLTQ